MIVYYESLKRGTYHENTSVFNFALAILDFSAFPVSISMNWWKVTHLASTFLAMVFAWETKGIVIVMFFVGRITFAAFFHTIATRFTLAFATTISLEPITIG